MQPTLSATLESALYTRDLEAAETFYHGILGLPVVARVMGRHVFFAVGPSMLLLFNPEATAIPTPPNSTLPVPVHGAKGAGHYCFAVLQAEMEALRTHLQDCNVAIEADFTWPNGARSIYVRDPAGNSIEFAEPRLWALDAPVS